MTTNHIADNDTTTADETSEDQDIYPKIEKGIDPRDLRVDDNSREVGDIREQRPWLVAAIAEHGVNPKVSIINVVEDTDGVYRVLVGFHRTAAAVAVKSHENPDLLIPVLVHAPGTTRREVKVAQALENLHREGYTPAEEANVYAQLAFEDLDDDALAKTLSRPVERVRAGRAVASDPRTHAASQTLPDEDLFTMAQLAEFGDDEAAHQKLVDVLNDRPYNFDFTLRQLRRKRQEKAKQAEESQRLAEQGYAVIDNEDDLPGKVARLDELCTGDDQEPLDSGGHSNCPGRAVAVAVNPKLEAEVTEFCLDYAEHGHYTIVSVKLAAAEAQLRADGVPIVADPDADGVAELRDLFADGKAEHALTVDEHATCPGHAAYATADPYESDVDVYYVCTDYATHGHVLRTAPSARPERDAAWKAAEHNRTKTNNKAWRQVKPARREWLAEEFFKGWRKRDAKKLPPGVHRWLALAPVLAGEYLKKAEPAHRYACTLLGLAEPDSYDPDRNPIAVQLRKKSTTETQAVLIRLAQVIGACEEHWNLADTDKNADSSWRSPSPDTRFYFELLDALGYPLEHVEKLINNPDLDIAKWPHLAADARKATGADGDQAV